MSAAECIGASIEGVDVSSDSKASPVDGVEEADATNLSSHGKGHETNDEIIETINTNDQVIRGSINCDSVSYTIDSTSFIEGSEGDVDTEGASEKESKEINSEKPLRPILTNGGTSIPRLGSQGAAQRKKSVSFDEVDDNVKKFINGDPIIDKQNPFKQGYRGRYRGHTPNGQTKHDDDFITKEEVLKESKFVRTYIKNPDKYFTYDPSIIERLKDETEEHSTRIPTPKKPIPIPRKLSKTTKERLKELTIKYSPPKFYTPDKEDKPPTRVNGRVDRSKYPDLADIKVKTGTDWEQSLYNPDEVAINVKKFDNRYASAQFGSQDDLDDIAEQTDADLDVTDNCDPKEVSSEPDNGKKSFTNTVNSDEFKEFLKKKGLTLTPQTQTHQQGELIRSQGTTNGGFVAPEDTDRMESRKKRSMLQRLFNGGLFSSKGKTTPKEVNFTQGSPRADDDGPMKRVVLERTGQTPHTRTSLPANNEFHKVFGGRSEILSEDYVDMNPSSSKQQVRVVSGAKEIHENYIDMTPKSSVKRHMPVPQVRSTASVHHVDSTTGANRVLDAQNIYRNIDLGKPKPQTRLRTPAKKSLADAEKPPVMRRTPVRQSLQPRAKVVTEAMYGNLNRSNSLPRHEPPPMLPQRNTRLGIVVSEPGYQSSPEKTPVKRGPKSTSTPVEEQNTEISNDLSPIVASTSIQVDPRTWLKIKELKDMTDRNLLYSTPKSNKPVAENIYESTEKLRPQQYGRISGRRASVENAQVAMVRNSPQRSTIDTVYKNRNLKIVDGQCVDPPEQSSPPVTRERSQSVLDDMITPTYGTLGGQTRQEGVVLRRRQPVYLSREEILNRVKEFCRKSMNNTPTKEQTAGKASPEISPVSYASVDSRRSGRVAPQVPRRVESLQRLPESPLYAPVYRQAMPQVQRTPNPVATQLSDKDVVDTRPHYQTPPSHLLQVGNQIYAPIRQPIPTTMYGDISPYGYLHLRNTVTGFPPRAPRPSSVQGNPYQRRPLDGRSTPLVLHSVNPRVEQVVYSRPQKQHPRPTEGRHHNVPYESESGSEAGEIQRILQRKVEEDWQNEKGGSSSGRAQQQEQAAADDRRRGGRREDPRRHTLGGDMMHYGPGQGPPPQRTMDLEVTHSYTRAYH